MTMLQHGVVPSSGGYNIERSLRFNSADSAYLSRTPASAGNRKTWTWSGWVKRGSLGSVQNLFTARGAASDSETFSIAFDSTDILNITLQTVYSLQTTQVYRDPSAWYHIVFALDTTQATASNRMKLYVNGSQITAFSTTNYPSQNADLGINFTSTHGIGFLNASGFFNYFNGYMADVHFIDGSALTPSSFGENDTDTGVWKPKAYTGSYGTNGFKLTFSDNSGTTATTLGKDTSGNGNNWTPNNFSVTAGAGNDSLVDTPTPYGTDTGAGGEVRGNYATLNPLDHYLASFSNGNLNVSLTGGNPTPVAFGTFGITVGKWYWEMTGDSYSAIGVAKVTGGSPASRSWQNAAGYAYFSNGNKANNNSSSSYGASYTNSDVIGVALDMDAGTLVFYKNGVSQGTAFTGLNGSTIQPMLGDWSGQFAGTGVANFGARPFAYTAPSGFKALCTTNLPTPAIGATSTTRAGKYFNSVLYVGNGTSQSVTGVGFQPDLVWIKDRTNAYSHTLYDVVRGTGTSKALYSNLTDAENAYPANNNLSSFDSDGFTIGSTSSTNILNTGNLVAWNWKANGAGSSNTAGSITSTVSANTTAGFSIVTYTGTGATGGTVGHGLGVKPGFIIVKKRSATGGWVCWHQGLTGAENGKYIYLNNTDAAGVTTDYWGSGITSSTFGVWTSGGDNNTSGATIVAYCFAEVEGFSKFGSYTGNGSTDGPMIFTGFRPAYILVKCSSTGSTNWFVWDNKINSYNVASTVLLPNTSGAELGSRNIDILSNGFKCRANDSNFNGSGDTYIYAAFAEVPQKFSLAR